MFSLKSLRQTVAGLFGAHRASRLAASPRKRRSLLHVEQLEDRQVLSASWALAAGELTITADPAGSQVLVQDLNPYNSANGAPILMVTANSANGNWTIAIPKQNLLSVRFVGSNQADSFTLNTGFVFVHPSFPLNYGAIAGNIDGRLGNDVLTGGMGNDTIYGGWGNDTINGMGGNDTIYGDVVSVSYKESLYASSWGYADQVSGGWGDDTVHGGYGDDTIRGNEGKDTLHGNEGHDNLYGGADADSLFGGSGRDGLFGGDGTNYLDGGGGADRFLVHRASTSLNTVFNLQTEDALVNFVNGTTRDVELGSNIGWVRAYADQWTMDEIEIVDRALDAYVDLTRNTTMLETATGASMNFERYGTLRALTQNADGSFTVGLLNTTTGGWNEADRNTVCFTDKRFSDGASAVMRVVFHELAHNFDERSENAFIDAFRAVAGWEDFSGRTVPPGHENAQDANWSTWYFDDKDADRDGFARNYGKQNPLEDFATAVEAYMLARLDMDYYGQSPESVETRLADRFAVLDNFFASIASPLDWSDLA